MLKKLCSCLPNFFLVLFIVGCSELLSQFTREADSFDHQNHAEAEKVDIPADVSVKESAKRENKHSSSKYLIESTDVLNIKVFDVPELSLTVRVSDEGILAYPLIGDMQVEGLTTQEVENILEERLRNGYLKNPEVSVDLDFKVMEQTREKEVYVLGEVKTPGAIPLSGKYLTVLEAVTKAGGFSEFAAPNRTKVIRVEDGVEKTIKVNLNKVKKGDKSLDIILKPGDVVVVPESYF